MFFLFVLNLKFSKLSFPEFPISFEEFLLLFWYVLNCCNFTILSHDLFIEFWNLDGKVLDMLVLRLHHH